MSGANHLGTSFGPRNHDIRAVTWLSSQVAEMGFSKRTCRPAFWAKSATSSWRLPTLGTMISTASKIFCSGSASERHRSSVAPPQSHLFQVTSRASVSVAKLLDDSNNLRARGFPSHIITVVFKNCLFKHPN